MRCRFIMIFVLLTIWIGSAGVAAPPVGAQATRGSDPIFAHEPPPPPPDYAVRSSWEKLPDPKSRASFDVFYVHPTTYRGPRWNQEIDDAAANAVTDSGVMISQASAFAGCCRLYAPRYRQASWRAFGAITGEGAHAYDLGYQDIKAAFAYYLAHDNHGRPFILAGHSQGALDISRLLEDEVDGKPVSHQLIAAYVIGIGISKGLFGKAYKTTRICAKPDEIDCLVSWNSFVEGSDISAYLAQSAMHYVKSFGDDPGKAPICVNPLTFDTARPDGERPQHLGAVVNKGSPVVLRAHLFSTQCRGGALFVDASSDPSLLHPLPGGSLHMQDVELFYADVAQNALRRARAWQAASRASAGRAHGGGGARRAASP